MSKKDKIIEEYKKNGGSYDRVSKVCGCTAGWVALVIRDYKKEQKMEEFKEIINLNK